MLFVAVDVDRGAVMEAWLLPSTTFAGAMPGGTPAPEDVGVRHNGRVTRSSMRLWRRGLFAVAAVVAFAIVVVPLPGFIVTTDIGDSTVTAEERLRAIGTARTALLSALAGIAVAVGAYATWRRLGINEEELRTSRDGQMTERYSRAVEHLGHESTDVRMGGVHALERLARNSPEDRDSVVAVLCAYVRGHSPWPPTLPQQPAADAVDVPSLAVRAADVQAALIVLGRVRDGRPVGLPHTDLRYARLTKLDLAGANFDRAAMPRARLRGCNLRGALLQATDLRDSDMTDADLRGADLRGADLDGARLAGARGDAATTWPDGFDPVAAGLRIDGRDSGAA